MELKRYEQIYGENLDSGKSEVWQLRANAIKIDANDLEKRLGERYPKIERIKWYGDALLVETKENLSRTLEHVLGYFFLQNISSMIPPLVLEPQENDRILDLTAAPGAKTTQMAAMMNNKGVIVANDITNNRLKALRGNLQRCGAMNTIVTEMDGRFFASDIHFNKILLDAPCTGTGSLSPRVLKATSENTVRRLSHIQKQLLASAARCLEKDGTLVYSTCSLEPEENEENVDFAVRKLGLVPEEIRLKDVDFVNGLTEWHDRRFDENVSNAIRVIPNGIFEGFFVCKLRKY